jgi:hypothetical protein
MAAINAGVASTLGGGVVGRSLGWTVEGGFGGGLASWSVSWSVCGVDVRTLDGRMGGGALGLQFLATTVSSSSSSSNRMWKTNGICLMALGVMMLFAVVATLSGGVVATLRLGATILVAGASTVSGVACCPAMIAASSWMAWMSLIFAAVNVGTLPPITSRWFAAAAIKRSCCKATGTWQWAGYRCQVSEKRKRRVAGMENWRHW